MATSASSTKFQGDAPKNGTQLYLHSKLWSDESTGDPGLQGNQVHGERPGNTESECRFQFVEDTLSEPGSVGAESFPGSLVAGNQSRSLPRPVPHASGARDEYCDRARDYGMRKRHRVCTR